MLNCTNRLMVLRTIMVSLIGLEDGKVVIEDEGQIYAFPRQDIAVVRLVIEYLAYF
jgi:hypothetical protein